uniref:Uncharacterized protein n=1 Tax=Percolomonas cosmopolitus TaxID=63605 RepID=A0A7S1PIH8_9EUKA|mmetsp:Transcript_7794/g.29167  ORF Transcript_7794/g.29167 Transcript_7794/m.29167 type:complete len:368 (+) Transcript_7794:108-1211(+)
MSLSAHTPYNHFVNTLSSLTILTLLVLSPYRTILIISAISLGYFLIYLRLYKGFIVKKRTKQFRGKKSAILITGCSSGIGEACAAHFIKNSQYHILATFRKQGDVEEFEKNNLHGDKERDLFTPLLLDVTQTDTIEKCMPTIRKVHKNTPVIALINNAGLQMSTIVENMDIDGHIRRGFDVNVLGVYRMVKAMLPLLRESKQLLGRARIITLSSMAGMIALPTATAYSSSKWAAQAISQGLRIELARFGIETCTINPGSIRTNFRLNSKADLERYLNSATPEMKNKLYPEYYKLWQDKYNKYFKEGEGYEDGKGISVERAVALVEETVETSHLQQSYFLGSEGTLVSVLSILPQVVTDWALRKTYKV